MSESIVNYLKNRQLSVRFNPKNFININYFNESMIDRMEIEHTFLHATENWNFSVEFGSWNSTGALFGCGKPKKGVQVFKPFGNFQTTEIPVQYNHCMSDALFMPKSENLMTVASRSRRSFLWRPLNAPEVGNHVEVWDVVAEKVTRKYRFRGVVKKLATSPSQPNNFWFLMNLETQRIAEADIRSPSLKLFKLDVSKRHANYSNWPSFDVNPVDEVTVVVGDVNKLLFYDRRMISSTSGSAKEIDISSLNDSISLMSSMALAEIS